MRTFTLSNSQPQHFFENSHRPLPTRHQAKSDRAARALAREEARKLLRRTGFESDVLAIRLAEQGFGVNEIYARTGIDRRILRKLVLGE